MRGFNVKTYGGHNISLSRLFYVLPYSIFILTMSVWNGVSHRSHEL